MTAIQNLRQKKYIASGIPVSAGVATGHARLIQSNSAVHTLKKEEIAVIPSAGPAYREVLSKALAVISEQSDQKEIPFYHTARSKGIPMVINAKGIMKHLRDGRIITVNGTTGEIIPGGILPAEPKTGLADKSTHLNKTVTKVFADVRDPAKAIQAADTDSNGIGIIRGASFFRGFPEHTKEILKKKGNEFVTKHIAEQLEPVLTAFHPRPVLYSPFDLLTDELIVLHGGIKYTGQERNPILGLHGTYKILHDPGFFRAELTAIRMLREKADINNLWLMLPFSHTLSEYFSIRKLIASEHIQRSPAFKIFFMLCTPANALLLERYCREDIDGISIDAASLTALTLGADRTNDDMARLFDPADPSLLTMYRQIINTVNSFGMMSSIHNLTEADFRLTEYLVRIGINGISVVPEAVGRIRDQIRYTEQNILTNRLLKNPADYLV